MHRVGMPNFPCAPHSLVQGSPTMLGLVPRGLAYAEYVFLFYDVGVTSYRGGIYAVFLFLKGRGTKTRPRSDSILTRNILMMLVCEAPMCFHTMTAGE